MDAQDKGKLFAAVHKRRYRHISALAQRAERELAQGHLAAIDTAARAMV